MTSLKSWADILRVPILEMRKTLCPQLTVFSGFVFFLPHLPSFFMYRKSFPMSIWGGSGKRD